MSPVVHLHRAKAFGPGPPRPISPNAPPPYRPHRFSLQFPLKASASPASFARTQDVESFPHLSATLAKPLFSVDRTPPNFNHDADHDQSHRDLVSRSLSVQPPTSASNHCFMPMDRHRRHTTTEHSIHRPSLFQAKFGAPPNWALDIFTLPHNAIRAECVDLYNILESIQARTDNVSLSELEEFSVWWKVFDVFLIEYFDFEADVLFSWVFPNTKDAPRNGSVSQILAHKSSGEVFMKNSLLTTKERLLESLMGINNTFELRRHVDSQDVFQTVLKDVNQFVPKLIEYFRLQERHLPLMMSHFYSPSAKETITRKYINYIRNGEAPNMNIAILTRWMDKPVREKWIRENLRGISRIVYPRWERKCIRDHTNIPFNFHGRLLRSVRNVAASRLRRRTEYGEEIEDISYGSLASPTGSFRSLSLAINSKSSSTLKSGRSREAGRSRGKLG